MILVDSLKPTYSPVSDNTYYPYLALASYQCVQFVKSVLKSSRQPGESILDPKIFFLNQSGLNAGPVPSLCSFLFIIKSAR